MTLSQAATKSRTNFAGASSQAYTSASARSCECTPNTRSAAVALHFRSPVARSRPSYTFSAVTEGPHALLMSTGYARPGTARADDPGPRTTPTQGRRTPKLTDAGG